MNGTATNGTSKPNGTKSTENGEIDQDDSGDDDDDDENHDAAAAPATGGKYLEKSVPSHT